MVRKRRAESAEELEDLKPASSPGSVLSVAAVGHGGG